MKLTFIVYYEHVEAPLMAMLKQLEIDYYTQWNRLKGKGHGTEPHIGEGSFVRMNAALMIAFEDEAPLNALIASITAFNVNARRADEKIRLFQVPLERVI